MKRISSALRRLGRMLSSRRSEADMEEEIRQHLEHEVEKNIRSGMSPEAARRKAAIDFGGMETMKDEVRDARGLPGLEVALRDLRYAVRSLRKNPGFSVIAILTLALGIGASTAMFTLVNTVLLRPLELPDPERVVVVWEVTSDGDDNVTSPALYTGWREQARSFEDLAAYTTGPANLTGDGDPVEVLSQSTSPNFFSVLRAPAHLGRTYSEDEPDDGVVVLGYRLWQSRYGGDPEVIGRTLTLNGRVRTILGVMPPDFRTLGRHADIWAPMQINPTWWGRFLIVVGRLRPGVTLEQARSEIQTITPAILQANPRYNPEWSATVLSMHEEVTGDVRPALVVLLGAVGLLLLIACANVASLLLGRAAARRKEMAVRLSLGATRGRLVRQTLTESVLLAGIAGAVGLGLAVFGTRMLARVLPADLALPRLDEVSVDGRVLAFALIVSLGTGILFGIAPALSGSAVRLAETLREATRGTTGGRTGLRRGLVVGEVALAVVLLVGAGLLARSLQRLVEVETGIRPESVLTMRMSLSANAYPEQASLRNFYGELLPRWEAMPGASAVGGIQYLPLTGEKMGHAFYRADRPLPPAGEEPSTDIRVIAGDYFAAMGIPLLAGRTFEPRDDETAPNAFIINEELARRHYPGENPVGKPISYPWIDEPVTGVIVGVVGSVREMGPTEEPAPAIYRTYQQMPSRRMTLLIRTGRDPLALAAPATAAVREIDPNLPIAEVRTMEQVVSNTVARPRLTVYLLGGFAVMALLLAGIGLYGIISYSVTQRSHEIGVRVALGAARGDVVRLIVAQGMALTGLGLVLGLLAALAATRVLTTLLFGIAATDPLTLASVSGFLAAVALFACYLPARRASRVDAMVALRTD